LPQKSARLSSINLIDYDFYWAGEHRQTLLQEFVTRSAQPPD
jgi:hypothetical protein